MERKVKFHTSTKFEVTNEELQYLYTLIGLIQYTHDCTPEYKDQKLIRRLRNEFNRYNIEITKACEKNPNNYVLNQIRIYIQRHYGYLKMITKSLELQTTK